VQVQPRPSRSAGSDWSGRALRRTDRHCAAVRLDAGEQKGQPDKHHPRRHPFRRDIWGNRHIGECRLITSHLSKSVNTKTSPCNRCCADHHAIVGASREEGGFNLPRPHRRRGSQSDGGQEAFLTRRSIVLTKPTAKSVPALAFSGPGGLKRGFGGVLPRIGRITSARAPLGPRGSAGALPHALPTTCHRRLHHPRRHHRRYACPRRYRANRERTVLVPGSLAPGRSLRAPV
jgi:hypothetical protein